VEDQRRRQERYNKREMEYRMHIDELQRELRVRLGYEKQAAEANKAIYTKLHSNIESEIGDIGERVKKLKEE